MIHSSRAGRVAAAVILVLVVAAVAAASMRWKQWTPSNACLLCGAGDMDVPAASPASSASATGTSGLAPLGAGKSTASALSAAPLPGPAGEGLGERRVGAGREGWQPWGPGSGGFRAYSGDGQGPSSSLGGLWRLMSLVRPGQAPVAVSTSSAAAARPERAASTPRQPRSAPPAAGPRPPAAPPAAAPVAAAPTDAFREHEEPLPSPFDPQAPGGPLDPGGPGGGGGSGGDLSPTPEPGSMLLIGTGLVGILGALRRRRLI